jgi:hypothetical protein
VIPDGERNARLTSLAGTLRRRGLTADEMLPTLEAVNARRGCPPLARAELARIAQSVSRYPPADADGAAGQGRTEGTTTSQPGQAQRLLSLAEPAELFHALDGETAYGTIPVGDHRETWPIRSKGFRRWLVRRFFVEERKPPNAQALTDALGVLEARAHFDAPAHPVSVRIAEVDGILYLDLANDRWEVVEITAEGWRVTANASIRFRRARGMLPLPPPVGGGCLDELRPFVNVATDADWRLFVGWLVAAMRPAGPYPVLVLHGEQGSAKSTTARVARCLVDPNVADLRADPRDPRDVMIAATNGCVLAYDNLSHIPPGYRIRSAGSPPAGASAPASCTPIRTRHSLSPSVPSSSMASKNG